MNREPFYALIRKQTLQWQMIDAGKLVDEESIKNKPLKPKKVKRWFVKNVYQPYGLIIEQI